MSSFRRLIIGIAEVAAIVWIVGFTIVGGFVGLASKIPLMLIMNSFGAAVPDQAVFGLLCFILGMVVSFLVAAVLAAFMFTLSEIAENTRVTRQLFDNISDARFESSQRRLEPRFQ